MIIFKKAGLEIIKCSLVYLRNSRKERATRISSRTNPSNQNHQIFESHLIFVFDTYLT